MDNETKGFKPLTEHISPLIDQGLSKEEIIDRLNKEGVKSRRGGKVKIQHYYQAIKDQKRRKNKGNPKPKSVSIPYEEPKKSKLVAIVGSPEEISDMVKGLFS